MNEAANIAPEEMVSVHSDYLLNYAMAKLGDIDLAKDLVQDTFVSALGAIDSFEKRASLRTWLTSILKRKIIDHWRKAETRYTDPVSQFFDENDKKEHWIEKTHSHITMDTAETIMLREESHRILWECLEILPAKWKSALVSKFFEEENSEELCKELSITTSNLWVIIHRSKLLLRDCIQQKSIE